MENKNIIIIFAIIVILIIIIALVKTKSNNNDNDINNLQSDISYEYNEETGFYTILDENGEFLRRVRDKSELELYLNSDYRATPPDEEEDSMPVVVDDNIEVVYE